MPAALGEICDDDPCDPRRRSCGPDGFCAQSATPGAADKTCVPGQPLFGDCVPHFEILEFVGCRGDAYCQPAECISDPIEGIVHGMCSAYKREGFECDGEQLARSITDCSLCQAGLRCLDDPTTRDHRCRKPCSDASDCPCESVCLEDGFCITCKDDGEACGYTGKPDSGECCEEGSICGAIEGSLSGRCCKALGVTCSADSDCCDGSLCDGDSGTCVPCGFTGDDCDEQNCCSSTAVCMGPTDARTCCSPDDKEICDGIDNDCDGQIDEDFNVGAECDGIGACAVGGPGVIECDGEGRTRCSVGPGGSQDRSSPEICDGIDNNCDGRIDENLDGQIESGPECLDSSPRVLNECGRGMKGKHRICEAGVGWQCYASHDFDYCTNTGQGPPSMECGGRLNYGCGPSTFFEFCQPNLTCWPDTTTPTFTCQSVPAHCGGRPPPKCWDEAPQINPTCSTAP